MRGTSEERCAFPECGVESYPGGHRAHDRDCYGLNLGLSGPGCHALVSFRSAAESRAKGVGKPSTLGSDDAPSAEPLPADNKAAEAPECEACRYQPEQGGTADEEADLSEQLWKQHHAYEARLRDELSACSKVVERLRDALSREHDEACYARTRLGLSVSPKERCPTCALIECVDQRPAAVREETR